MELTEKQQTWLEQLVVNGYVLADFDILQGKAQITLKSISGAEQLAAENAMKNLEGSQVFILHTYAIKQLAQVLKKYKAGKDKFEFLTPDEAEVFISARATVVLDSMIHTQSEFEKELKKLTTPEVVESNFSKTPETVKG